MLFKCLNIIELKLIITHSISKIYLQEKKMFNSNIFNYNGVAKLNVIFVIKHNNLIIS